MPGFLFSFCTGLRYPLYALLMGELFVALSKADVGEGLNDCFSVSIGFAAVGIFSGITSFLSGYFLGSAGEKMAFRLRMAVFTVRLFETW